MGMPAGRQLLLLRTALAAALLAVRPVSAGTADNGAFRFLTLSLPGGSTNAEYVARVLTANADGPVAFTITGLAPGLNYDPASGFITGRPTVVGNYHVDITATDGPNTITQNNVPLKVSAAGGGGNGGATFNVNVLPDGTVGVAYSATLTVTNGVGPYTFGAVDLPPGIILNGQTGVLSGTPLAAGTFFCSLSVYDAGENNKVVKVVPLLVEPAASAFQFTTRFLNNGEVGTPFWDQWLTSGGTGPVRFGASGLPPGLSVDPAAGVVSGSPTVAGTFTVIISATDTSETISTNLQMVIVPSSTSHLYWNFFGLPTGFVGASYARQPPILVAAINNTGTMTYSAVGIPAGMSYNPNSGELTGTPLEVGEYPITFTARDAATGEVLTLAVDFIVLPPYGGDASSISTNLWVTTEKLKTGVPAKASWTGQGIWNADRRTGTRFNPLTDALRLQIGSDAIDIPPGSLTGTVGSYRFTTPRGQVPMVKVQLSLVQQTLKWIVKRDGLSETVPGTLRHTTIIGGRGYLLDEAFNTQGAFKPALAYRKTAFIVSRGALKAVAAGKGSVMLSLFLADPSFHYESRVSTLRVRILDGANELLSKNFTALGTGTTRVDPRTRVTVYRVKASKDPASTDRLSQFVFLSSTGKMVLKLARLNLAMPSTQNHLGVELTIGDRIYYTAVTFFENRTGSFTTTMPGR
jgi:hypothetical protein